MEKETLPEITINPPPVYTETNAPHASYPIPANHPNQPTVIIINNDPTKKCPECGQENAMEYQDVLSTRQHLWALCLCLSFFFCCWIPYVSNQCMHNQGKCKNCGYKTKDKTNNTGLIAAIAVLIILIIIGVIISLTGRHRR